MRTAAHFCVALALSAGAAARVPDIDPLRSYETPSYTLIATEKFNAPAFVPLIANFEKLLAKMLATDVRPTGTPTYIYVVRARTWNRYLRPSRDIAGEFVPTRFANYLLLNADVGHTQVHAGVLHEYTHLFLRTQFGGYYPLWFDEGLAEMMSRTQMRRDLAIIGVPDPAFASGWLPVARLLEIDKSSAEYLEAPTTEYVHRESWALMHRGLIADTNFGGGIFRYLKAVNELQPAKDAVQDSFGMSVAQLDSTLRAYLAQTSFDVGRISFEPAPPVALGQGRLLDPAEANASLARVMLDTGFNPQHVDELIDAAEIAAPGSPRVAVLRLRLAVRDRNDGEVERISQSLLDTSAPAIARGVGLALFERVRETAPKDSLSAAAQTRIGERAFALLDRGLRADSSDPEAAWAYALLAARFKAQLDVALERLASVKERMRDNADLAMATALVYEAREEPEAMLPQIVEVARHASSIEQRRWAVRRYRELLEGQRKAAPE